MNPIPNETEAIRSEINTTRRRMDDTIDALGDRFRGRHLLDELLGFIRSDSDRSREVGQKITQTASSAMNSITDTVKANPAPALLIGAGVAWMIYNHRREPSFEDSDEFYGDPDSSYARIPGDPDVETHYDRPLDYPSSAAFGETPTGEYNAGGSAADSGMSTGGQSKLGAIKSTVAEKASAATQQVKQRLSDVSSRVRDRSGAVGQHTREMTSRVQQRARDTYQRNRERVVNTADQHPLELGLACIAAGLIAGLVMRTPERLNQLAGPSVDRLRERTREAGGELLDKGQRIATAAADAAKNEAQNQGLTPEQMRTRASENKNESSHRPSNPPPGGTATQPQADPLASRPVM